MLFKKSIIFIIIFSMMLTVLSCSESENGSKTDTESVSETTIINEEPETEIPAPDIPAMNYEGYKLTILTNTNYNTNFRLNMEDDADPLNDASYKRNLALKEKYNIEFEIIENDNYLKLMSNSITASDGAYDFIFPHATAGVAQMITNNYLYNWNDVDYVDFTKPWWNSSMTENLSIGDNLYYVSGDIVLTWQGLISLLFNKDFIENNNIGIDFYQLVFDGSWTYDKLNSVIKGMASDLNGDSEMDDRDIYGLLKCTASYADLFAMNQRITERDENGIPQFCLNSEHMADVVTKYYNTVYNPDTFLNTFSSVTYATGTYRSMILEGRSFFSELDIGSLHTYLREIEHEFGILPLPKYDENQNNYRVFCGAGLIGIPSYVTDIKLCGAVAEDMAYYSYKYMRPAFFDIVLQNKALRDGDSYKVLQMMHENKTFDFGFNFDSTGLAFSVLTKVVLEKKSTDFASYYKSIEKQITSALNKVIESFNQGE